MPDVLLFGATGFTGRLTAGALARRGAEFVIAGRDRAKLDALADEVEPAGLRVIETGDVESLVRALSDVRALISCVGPFVELGATAVQAALSAGVHYVDSTGEADFVKYLITRRTEAEAAGVTLAPCMAFDEVPADVVATMAVEGLEPAELTLTYALPRTGSAGTLKTTMRTLRARAPFIEDGVSEPVGAGERRRWAPLPQPLGVRASVSYPFAMCHLAPLHLSLRKFQTFVTAGGRERAGLRVLPAFLRSPLGPIALSFWDFVIGRVGPAGPSPQRLSSARFTILAEAQGDGGARNVTITGVDVYGLSAELLAVGGLVMAQDGYEKSGVLSPVQAVGLDALREVLTDHGAEVEVFDRTERKQEEWAHD